MICMKMSFLHTVHSHCCTRKQRREKVRRRTHWCRWFSGKTLYICKNPPAVSSLPPPANITRPVLPCCSVSETLSSSATTRALHEHRSPLPRHLPPRRALRLTTENKPLGGTATPRSSDFALATSRTSAWFRLRLYSPPIWTLTQILHPLTYSLMAR